MNETKEKEAKKVLKGEYNRIIHMLRTEIKLELLAEEKVRFADKLCEEIEKISVKNRIPQTIKREILALIKKLTNGYKHFYFGNRERI